MGFPPGMLLNTIAFGIPLTVTGKDVVTQVTVKPTARVIWAATGQPMPEFADTFTAEAGQLGQFQVPATDQPGFIDAAGNAITDWAYQITASWSFGNNERPISWSKNIKPLQAQSGVIDLDLVPDGPVSIPVTAPTAAVLGFGGRTGFITLQESDLPQRLSVGDLNDTYATPAALALKVDSTDARLPQNIGILAGYKEVTVTTDGFVLSAVLDDGTIYNFFDTASPARTADPVAVPGYRNLVFDKTKTYVLEADKEDGSKYFHKVSANVLDIPETAITRTAAVASFGDSMTGDAGGTGTTTGAYLGTVLGLPAFQGGVPGQTTTEASFRGGGTELWGSITGGSIPTSGTVAVVINIPTGTWASASAWTFPVKAITENGTEVPGSLVKAAGNTWTFQATFLTVAQAAPREVKFVSDEGATYAPRGIIFRAGRNNPDTDLDVIVRDYKAVRDRVYATQARPRFLALPLYNPSDAPSGSAIYNSYKSINDAIAKECGPDYYDLRRWLIKYGLSSAGITPTAQDNTDIAADIVPTSLRYNSGADTTHLTVAGRIAEATQIAHVIKSKGWFTS